jgi:hypothetical protein
MTSRAGRFVRNIRIGRRYRWIGRLGDGLRGLMWSSYGESERHGVIVPEELGKALGTLESLGMPYIVVGSLASVAWGRPRATYDADVVIDIKLADVERLRRSFPEPEWYLDSDSVRDSIRAEGEFNAIHGATGTKIDFWVRKRTATEAARFARRRRQVVAGVECWVLSPEDTILSKLEWIKMADSERQRGDVAGVIAVQGASLDNAYLREWAERLGVADLLAAMIRS